VWELQGENGFRNLQTVHADLFFLLVKKKEKKKKRKKNKKRNLGLKIQESSQGYGLVSYE